MADDWGDESKEQHQEELDVQTLIFVHVLKIFDVEYLHGHSEEETAEYSCDCLKEVPSHHFTD